MFVGALDTNRPPRGRRLTIGSGLIGAAAALVEISFVAAMSVVTGTVWHAAVYGDPGDIQAYLGIGALTGLLYTLPFLFRSEYEVDTFLGGRRTLSRLLNVWTYAFFVLAALAFLTKTSEQASRGALVLFFAAGCLTVVASDAILRRIVGRLVLNGWVCPRRLLLVGESAEVARFVERHSRSVTGIEVSATLSLPEALGTTGAVEKAIERARQLGVTDVLILPAGQHPIGEAARLADKFMDLPVAVHLGQLDIAERFPDLEADRIGNARTIALCSAPLGSYQRALKRAFDVLAASLGLVVLAVPLAIVALAIKLDSPGPVFFRQRRRGFNHREFRIWKFRTMSSLDDGANVPQARANDPRVTRVGRVLRKLNIDELPQLINVLAGDMALVGPRPHAVAHDQHYERVIRRYPRRLNVKPGITGWAQVNGFRGLTETDHAMRSRIAHDLYYIDNWSIALDLYIIALTVVSPKAFRNAH
ncbi:MAG: exopolysaccharide biosynthesis polyprenyl glycosylphosphotransferase [Hyphomicrobiaceae bacterium]